MSKPMISWNNQTPVNLDRITFINTENHKDNDDHAFFEIQFIGRAPIFEHRYSNDAELDRLKENGDAPYKIIEQKPISWMFDTVKERDNCYDWILRKHTENDQSEQPMAPLWDKVEMKEEA
jgi:hypothetical protein